VHVQKKSRKTDNDDDDDTMKAVSTSTNKINNSRVANRLPFNKIIDLIGVK